MTISSDKSKYAKLIGYLCGEQSKQIFMVQKQKLKSERVNPNVGIKDLFLVLDPRSFRKIIDGLKLVRDTDKKAFCLLLEMFEKHKHEKVEDYDLITVLNRKYIRRDRHLNEMLSTLLLTYWCCRDHYDGGYFKRLLPKEKKANESDNAFRQRLHRMEDLLMDVSYEVLDDLDFFIHY